MYDTFWIPEQVDQDEGSSPMMDLVEGAADPIRIQRPRYV